MGWKIIEIEKRCFLKTFNSNLIIFDVKKITIPMSDIDVLLISNTQINISISAVNDLIDHGVCIIMCNQSKLPNSYILGYKVQKQSYINFEKQMTWTLDYKNKCWEWLLHKKIYNQLDLLSYYKIENKKWLYEVENSEQLGSTMLEAQIASYFFKSLFGMHFNRQKENVINYILDYGYTILTNMVARSIAKKGLNLNISFFHGSIYSPFPLAYDIVEIFRIIIDIFAKYMLINNILDDKLTLTRDIKSCLLDYIANYKIQIDDKYEFINNSIDKVIDWIISGEIERHQIKYNFEIECLDLQGQENDKEKLENQI